MDCSVWDRYRFLGCHRYHRPLFCPIQFRECRSDPIINFNVCSVLLATLVARLYGSNSPSNGPRFDQRKCKHYHVVLGGQNDIRGKSTLNGLFNNFHFSAPIFHLILFALHGFTCSFISPIVPCSIRNYKLKNLSP